METDNSIRSQAIILELKETHKGRDFMAFKCAQASVTFDSKFLENCELSLRSDLNQIDSLADGRAIMKTRPCTYSMRRPVTNRNGGSKLISEMIQSSSDRSKETVHDDVEQLQQDYLAGKSIMAAASLAGYLLIGHRDSNCSFGSLPFDIITEIACKIFLVSPPVIVFGFARGFVSCSDGYGAAEAIFHPRLFGSMHWNAGLTTSAFLFCQLHYPSIVKRIVLSVRCAHEMEIFAKRIGDYPRRCILPRTSPRKEDLDDCNIERVVEFSFPFEYLVSDYIEIYCEKGGNVSLHWVMVYGATV